MIQIKHVEWEEFPKEVHLEILKAVEVGQYLDSLPYKIPDGYLTWKVPFFNEEPVSEIAYQAHMLFYHPHLAQGIECHYMMFQRIRLERKGERKTVWQKVT